MKDRKGKKVLTIFKKAGKTIAVSSAVMIGIYLAVSFIMIGFQVQDVVFEHERSNQLIALADGNPGAGVGGFFYWMVYPHQAVPGTAYTSNLSNATAYEFSDTVNASLTGETPFDTTFDLVLKWGYNSSQDWNSTGTCWEDAWIWVTCTNADISIGADTNMTEIEIANTSASYRWMHYYMNNGGSGYTITHGQSCNTTSVKPWAYN